LGRPKLVGVEVAPLGAIYGTVRRGRVDRICAVANAYKHDVLNGAKHPIRFDADVRCRRVRVSEAARCAPSGLPVN
jgi:hypothetical protein